MWLDSYIFLIVLITNLVPDYYNISFLISRSPSLIASFYTLFPFHLLPPRAGQMVGVDTCPISTFLKSLCSSCKAENHCSSITSILMWLEGQLQSIQCSDSSFLLKYFKTLPIQCCCNAYQYQQNFLERSLGWQTHFSDLGSGQPMRHSSSAPQIESFTWSRHLFNLKGKIRKPSIKNTYIVLMYMTIYIKFCNKNLQCFFVLNTI